MIVVQITNQWLKDSCAQAADDEAHSGSGRLGLMQVPSMIEMMEESHHGDKNW
jgi:hypothetical protein